MRLNLIIKEVANNLELPYSVVNKVIRFAFSETSQKMHAGDNKFTIRYLGTFSRKLTRQEKYYNYLNRKKINEVN